MPQTVFYTDSFPPSFEFTGFRGWIARNVLGLGTGKFRGNIRNRQLITREQPVLINVSPGELMEVAMEVPHLNTVISTGAELFSLMEIKHLDKNKKPIENSEILKFLRQPNPLQSLEQYLHEWYVLNAVYNKTFQNKIKGLSYEQLPAAMWNLPSGWMKINVTGKVYRQTDITEIIENYELIAQNISDKYEVDEVIYMAEGIGNNILNPISRIEALQIPLSNIMASLKSRNIITSERGMIGFIAPEISKDSDGALPFDEKESKRVRLEYKNQAGLDSEGGHVHFTHAPLKWVPMTFDVRQLDLSGGLEDDFASICAAYRHDRDIYPSTKGATYENKSAGMKSTIQNGLQPLADKLMRQWTKHLIQPATGESLEACYNHLPAMKEDERLAAQGKLYKIQALSIALRDNVISHDQYAQEADLEMDGTGEAPTQPSPNYNLQPTEPQKNGKSKVITEN